MLHARGGRDTRPLALVVEDEPDIRLLFVDLLEHSGYHCLEAGAGHEAMDVVDDLAIVGRKLSIVVLDIMLPEMDGKELCTHFRRAHPGLAIVAVTALDATSELGDLDGAGFDAVERKPIDRRRFLDKCASAVRARSAAAHVR